MSDPRDCKHGNLARTCEICPIERDAERYRWLRDCASQQSLYAVIDLSGHKWDKAIDNMREAS